MHIEVRKRGGRRLYYLAHSFRDKGEVKKIRRYLGPDLSEEKIGELRVHAEKAIQAQIDSIKKIRDPLHTILSPEEIEEIKALVNKADIQIKHLSEEDWIYFTEIFTYDTNAIEGSTVESPDVQDILERDVWPSEKTKGEIAETYGVADAVANIRKTKTHISLNLIRKLHEIVFKNSKEYAGEFRSKGVEVVITDGRGNIIHRGAPQRKIVTLLRELITWYTKNKNRYHPLVLAAVVHNQFENIHPFQDGNGRVGRLLLNNILLKHNMPPVNIEMKNRRQYYDSLQEYEKEGNLRPTIELILKEYKRLTKTLKKM